jgi:two-component system, OmpR family, alkaline phosphatase synthesis response regulator PhoP
MNGGLKLCLVEDDPTIKELVAEKLRQRGYVVDTFESADEIIGAPIDRELYIVDILLRGENSGLDLCRSLRQLSPTLPILILSALSEPLHRVEGLKAGADDYLTKPFEMEELLLRVDGMLKRRSWYVRLPRNSSTFRWAENEVDFVNLQGKSGNYTFPMTQKECMLMKLLIEKEGEVVSRDEILDRVWGYNVYPSTRTVDNFILRLRKYFEKLPKAPKYIHSVRGMGYKFSSKE